MTQSDAADLEVGPYGLSAQIPDQQTALVPVAAELPMHVVMYNTHAGASLGHVLVVLEEASQAQVLVDYLSADADTQSTYIGATELLVGDGANLGYVGLQDWNRKTYEFHHQRGRVGRDANLDWIVGTMGGELVKDLLFKGAASDVSRTVWQGMIKALPQMQKIDGFQASRNLVLSEDARMDGIPGLEIEADDVRCTHAATFGTLEQEPVFYLMSRGIPRSEAELILIEGFFDELLERIPFEPVRDRLRLALDVKIIGRK